MTDRVSEDALVGIPAEVPVVINFGHPITDQIGIANIKPKIENDGNPRNIFDAEVVLFNPSKLEQIQEFIELVPAGVLGVKNDKPIFKLQSVSVTLKTK